MTRVVLPRVGNVQSGVSRQSSTRTSSNSSSVEPSNTDRFQSSGRNVCEKINCLGSNFSEAQQSSISAGSVVATVEEEAVVVSRAPHLEENCLNTADAENSAQHQCSSNEALMEKASPSTQQTERNSEPRESSALNNFILVNMNTVETKSTTNQPKEPTLSLQGVKQRKKQNASSPKKSPPDSKADSPSSKIDSEGYNSGDEHWIHKDGSHYDEGLEHKFEADIWRTKNLKLHKMTADGNCLFRSVSHQVYGDADMCYETRQMCVDYMEKERDHFSQFVTESFSAYCRRKRRDKIFGNNLEIQAMAEMYNRPIHIFSYSTEPINIFQGSYLTDLPPIRLSYHRNNHYNSLVDPTMPAVGAGLGFSSLRGGTGNHEQVKATIKAQQDVQIERALVAQGLLSSDVDLTEQQMEDLALQESLRDHKSARKEASIFTSYGCQPSSSVFETNVAEASSSKAKYFQDAEPSNSKYVGASAEVEGVATENARLLMSMGFNFLDVMQAVDIFNDNFENMMCYLVDLGSAEAQMTPSRCKGKELQR